MPPTSVQLCIFYRQMLKRVKGGRQSLTQYCTFDAWEAICSAVEIWADERVLLEELPGPGQPDAIAKEVSYHRACYADYTHPKTLRALLDRQQDEETSSPPVAAEQIFIRGAEGLV